MLMRFDPFREMDRLAQQLSQATQQAARSFPMDAYRRGDEFVVHFDLPGVDAGAIDIHVDNNVLTVKAERSFQPHQGDELIANERPQGTFTRQLLLGESLDTERITAGYDRGVLTLTIPVAERAKPRKVEISAASDAPEQVSAQHEPRQ